MPAGTRAIDLETCKTCRKHHGGSHVVHVVDGIKDKTSFCSIACISANAASFRRVRSEAVTVKPAIFFRLLSCVSICAQTAWLTRWFFVNAVSVTPWQGSSRAAAR